VRSNGAVNETAPQESQGETLIRAARELRDACSALRFGAPVAYVYNPLVYAWEPHLDYIRRYGAGRKRVVFVGMNPGPWGMAQTGVPFGEVDAVREWLGIVGNVERPVCEHPKRPVSGLDCSRSEVSGRRLWGLFRARFQTPERFFAGHFVLNYCPLLFVEEGGRNRPPDKLPRNEQRELFAACNRHLAQALAVLRPEFAVGIGAFAEGRVTELVRSLQDGELGTAPWTTDLRAPQVVRLLHPSPANPRANRDWAGEAIRILEGAGVW